MMPHIAASTDTSLSTRRLQFGIVMELIQWEPRKATASIYYKKGKEHSLLPFPLMSFASAQTKS